MQKPLLSIFVASLLAVPMYAMAAPYKDESGHGKRRHGHEYKEEYWDGNCKVQREIKKNGEYKEKRKCKGYPNHYPVRSAAPIYVTPEAGVVIHGTMHLR